MGTHRLVEPGVSIKDIVGGTEPKDGETELTLRSLTFASHLRSLACDKSHCCRMVCLFPVLVLFKELVGTTNELENAVFI